MGATTTERHPAQDPQWFASWFDSVHYHKLYAHRDDTEAAGFIDNLILRLRPAAGASILDLGCGAGRHSRHLAAKGFRVTGLDLAASSIQAAAQFERPGLRFIQHDMRIPFGRNHFDYVFNFFTSFGYFDGQAEHLRVIRNIARALKPDGRLVLDYLNVNHAEGRLTPGEIKQADEVTYRITRWSDARHFFKRILIEDTRSGETAEHVERVAKFSLNDFRRMLTAHGLILEAVRGDYGLNPYHAQTSPRMILIARKPSERRDYLRERFLRMRLSVSGETPRYDASIHCGTRSAMDG